MQGMQRATGRGAVMLLSWGFRLEGQQPGGAAGLLSESAFK